MKVPLSQFPKDEVIAPRMCFHSELPNGEMVVFTVMQTDDQNVFVDGNHPLAGQQLTFEVEITDVRNASLDELSHGHVHGPHGHHH
jgi:FKBP-type peptidyl-prolyl cis-trans isomerase SlyD